MPWTRRSSSSEEQADQEEQRAKVEELERGARLPGPQFRRHRHRPEYAPAHDQRVAIARDLVDRHQLPIVRTVEFHGGALAILSKLSLRSSHTRIAVPRPAPKT